MSFGSSASRNPSPRKVKLTSAVAIGEGRLVSPESHALQFAPDTAKFPPWDKDKYYGLGVFSVDGWVTQNPSFAGYAATMAYLPARKLVARVVREARIEHGGDGTVIGEAIGELHRVRRG